MHFTVKSATNLSGTFVNLDKVGNRYHVVVFEQGNYRTIARHVCNTYSNANGMFEILCARYGMKTEKDVDASEAYDYIASQYD